MNSLLQGAYLTQVGLFSFMRLPRDRDAALGRFLD